MTIKRVKEIIKEIEQEAYYYLDDEKAHDLQDMLYETVLRAIKDGHENPQEIASEALKAEDIDFARWYG